MYLAYLLFQSENIISSELDAIKFISFNQIKSVILLVKTNEFNGVQFAADIFRLKWKIS